MLLALLLLSLLGLFFQACVLIFILERTTPLWTMHERLIHVENYVAELSEMVSQQLLATDQSPIFRSLDGKYAAHSIEELTQSIINGEQINNAEGLKNFFDKMIQDNEELDDGEEDDV